MDTGHIQVSRRVGNISRQGLSRPFLHRDRAIVKELLELQAAALLFHPHVALNDLPVDACAFHLFNTPLYSVSLWMLMVKTNVFPSQLRSA